MKPRLLDSDPDLPDSSRERDSAGMRALNIEVRSGAGTSGGSLQIPFFCECQARTCYSPVWRSEDAFDAMVLSGSAWLLADGHLPSAPWPLTSDSIQQIEATSFADAGIGGGEAA
jgi:hypothetical protein